ncbi:MAG TPA: KH domain-containing protein, partial [Thermoanaerobaculia bacterium]|nr:KH domain-containing protein [Thermoanaerobaculia bacterium]
MSELQQELSDAVRLLVDDRDAVTIEEREAPDGVRFEIRVAAGDLGKVIGRQGRTIRALRTLLEARGGKDGVRYWLDILE